MPVRLDDRSTGSERNNIRLLVLEHHLPNLHHAAKLGNTVSVIVHADKGFRHPDLPHGAVFGVRVCIKPFFVVELAGQELGRSLNLGAFSTRRYDLAGVVAQLLKLRNGRLEPAGREIAIR